MSKEIKDNKELQTKWVDLLEGKDTASGESLNVGEPIKDAHKRFVTARLLENTEMALQESAQRNQYLAETGQGNETTQMDAISPVIMGMVRRLAPNINLAYDCVGVQPMATPHGVVFAYRAIKGPHKTAPFSSPGDARTGFQSGAAVDTAGNTPAQEWEIAGVSTDELFYYEADTTNSGTGTQTSNLTAPNYSSYSVGSGMNVNTGERLGTSGGGSFGEVSFTIEKSSVEAKTRALRTSWTDELAQDAKAVHGLDVQAELNNIISMEIAADTAREIINTIRYVALVATGDIQFSNGTVVRNTAGNPVLGTAGQFDMDLNSDGRWSNEKHKSLLMKINKEANKIAKKTRRGRANFIICSSDVASMLDLTGKMTYAPAIDNNLMVDDTGNTFVGVLQGRYKVYIDPYLGYDEVILGYKGASPMDAGMFFCPYQPLQFVMVRDPGSLQPVMAAKSRYGILANPFTTNTRNSNLYYVKFRVLNIA